MQRASQLLRVSRMAAGGAAGLTLAATAQGLYLWSQYRALPEPRGPLRGVVQYLREKQSTKSSASGSGPAHGAEGAPPAASASESTSTLVRHVSRGAAACFAASAAEEPATRPRKNILFVGDSLVTGVGCDVDGEKGPAMPRACAAFLAKALRVDVNWAAIGETGADVQGLRKLLPAVGREVRSAQDKGGAIDMVVVVVGLNDFKHAYQSLAWGSLRRTAIGFKGELASFVEALHRETGVQCTVVLPALPVAHAPVFAESWPFRPLISTIAQWWDDQKVALADASALALEQARSRRDKAAAAARRAGEAAGAGDAGAGEALPAAVCEERVCYVNGGSGEKRWNNRRYWAADGVHPSDEGYRVWGEHIGTAIVRQAMLAGGPSAGP